MNRSFAVLTASGEDRVGIVDDVSADLLDAGCNIEESRMSVLGGAFALIVLVSGEPDAIDTVLERLPEIGARAGLELTGRRTGAASSRPGGRPYRIESVSLDTPGIVHAITGLLRRRGVSIDELETETTGAPFTGAPMFQMRITAIVPQGIAIGLLKSEIAEVAVEQDLDVTIRPLVASEE